MQQSCTAAYSRKAIDWERIRAAALAGQSDLATLASSHFVEGAEGRVDVQDLRRQLPDAQLVEITRAGTGFMLVHREVFERVEAGGLVQHYAHNQVMSGKVFVNQGDRLAAFFDCKIDTHGDTFLSEDYSLCDNWRRAGGRIYLAPWIKLTHFEHVLLRIVHQVGDEKIIITAGCQSLNKRRNGSPSKHCHNGSDDSRSVTSGKS